MRFYSGDKGDEIHHHDIALVENRDLPPPPREWAMFGMPCAVNHVAITMPSREAWLAHLAYLQKKGIKFDRRLEHGMTHSLYIHDPNGYGIEFVYDLPKEIWKDDIDGALNWAKVLPTEGPEATEDRTEGLPTFSQSAPAAE
jgi:catechol 2,3-dioxygenase